MLAEDATGTRHSRHRPTCRICQRELPLSRSIIIIDGRRFCNEHWREYTIRKREGATSQDLNPDWFDTLGNWRERPSELDEEARSKIPSATPLYFEQRHGNWLLFMRGYYRGVLEDLRSMGILGIFPGKHKGFVTIRKGKRSIVTKLLHGSGQRMPHRASDCLAVNLETKEIRRFVDVQSETVLDDLEGRRPAPYQEEIASWWGKPEPTGIDERFRRQYMDERYHIRIADLVRLALFPVYSIVDDTSELAVRGPGWSGHVWGGINEISFVFGSPHDQQVGKSIEISSSDARQRHIFYDPEQAVNALFMSYHLSEEEQEQAGQPSTWEGEIIIDGVTFTGNIQHWSQPFQLSLFHLKSDKTLLDGSARDLSLEEVLQHLEELRIINDQENLLARYQHELDEQFQRLFC